jgi:hypothetical protein
MALEPDGPPLAVDVPALSVPPIGWSGLAAHCPGELERRLEERGSWDEV